MKFKVVASILENKNKSPKNNIGKAYAPSNIALAKYWGKRNEGLNLPYSNSLSISLGNRGAITEVSILDAYNDEIYLNDNKVNSDDSFYLRLKNFLDLFRFENNFKYKIKTNTNIPVAAGVASSACGFAAVTMALNNLFGWSLADKNLSVIARLGSGSASRSVFHGFVEWNKGEDNDLGLDSYAKKLDEKWQDLRIGLLVFDAKQKKISSRTAMKNSVQTSPFYKYWPAEVQKTIDDLKTAIINKNFELLGESAEKNSICMHAVMNTTTPPIFYANSQTIEAQQKIWDLRNNKNIKVYFTQDAGPNLKLIFLKSDLEKLQECFPNIEVIEPFTDNIDEI